MSFQIIGKTKDLKSGANVIYVQSSINKYLEIVGSDFENFSIQRKREKHKAYQRLKTDLQQGALLPSITLGVKHNLVENIIQKLNAGEDITNDLSGIGCVDILDGLQRTYIMKDIISEGNPFSNEQKLLLEFWLEPSLSKLIYRMIILNAGQKAMSMRHQVELLFLSLKDTIEGEVEGIQLLTERESTRRTSSKKFNLGHIASAYYAYITASSEIDKENLVAQHLSNNEILDSSESELNEKFESFITHLRLYVELDELAWNHYTRILPIYEQKLDSETDESEKKELKRKITVIKESLSWFSSENVMLSFFSAVAVFRNTEERKSRVIISLNSLKDELKLDDKEDLLGMLMLDKIKEGLNPKLHNIGFATRKQISNTFKEFFREKGEVVFRDCWSLAAE
ncbi:hypothetical protein [Aliarcobacter butzleri]|uniref:hypothetical protein n=1 Tax=Aliarcobacter butzleri TaxID=28197 RepID=UPI00263F55A6|nr:hypothetical protein [Aliarcobacter butzleri]MDN5055002.1 hypothetical protein [Aliarcobacter butzleri]